MQEAGALKEPVIWQAGALQDCVCCDEPEQLLPPYAGAGLVQVLVLVCVPVVPQAVAEQAPQALQALQPPLTGFISIQEGVLPPPEPWQFQVQAFCPFTLFMLVPEVQR